MSHGTRQSARPLLLASVFAGVSACAALSVVAPRYQGALKFSTGELATLAALASIIVGSVCIAMSVLFKIGSNRKNAKRSATQAVAHELPLLKDQPLSGTRSLPRENPPEARSSPETKHAAKESGAARLVYSDTETLAARLKSRRPSGGGHRILLTGVSDSVVPFEEAIELIKAIADTGAQAILIDWSPTANGFTHSMGLLDAGRGWNDLMRQGARFDEIIHRLPGTRAHTIAAGTHFSDAGAMLDADFVNIALDALDEAYDFIVVTGRHDEARVLFESIEGRFDAGILVARGGETARPEDPVDTFLGFEVTDIDIIRYQRIADMARPVADRIARATRPRETVTQYA